MPKFRFIYFQIILLAVLNTIAQGSAISPIKKTPTQIEKYNKLISFYRYENPDSAVMYVNKGLAYASLKKDTAGKAVMLNQLGMINDNRGKFDASRNNYLEAFRMYKMLNQTKGMATETIRLGVVEMRKGNYDKSIGYFLEALKYSESIKDDFGIMEANITLGEAYIGQHKYDDALKYLKIAEHINDRLPLSNLSLNLFNDYGVTYRETGMLEEAKSYLQKGINQSNVPQYQGLNITLTNNLATVYAKEGNTGYSIKLQKAALQKAIQIHNFIRELQTLNGLATSYQNINIDTSLSYLYRVKDISEGRQAYKQVIEALQGITELYKKKGDYKAALEAQQEAYALSDKYFYKEMSRQVDNLQTDYELSRSRAKVQELKYLNNRQILQRRIILAVAGSTLLILIFIAYSDHRSRTLNKKLTSANKNLDESNQVKDKLFSILGHDLRSPFVSVINMIDLVDDEDLPADTRSALLSELSVTSKAALETLTGLLKWGEMQIKGVRLNRQELLVKPLLERVLLLLNGTANFKQISIFNLLTDDITLIADADHVEFVLRNLISNAIKFTGINGKVMIKAFFDNQHNQVTIMVEDTGVGISPERIQSVFSLSNISSNGTYNEKGTSLGLLICKEFIEANAGTISVRSTLGVGSTFSFTLQGAIKTDQSDLKTRPQQDMSLS